MELYQVKEICAKFPQLELEVYEDDMPFYRCYVKNVTGIDDEGDRVILFGYRTGEDSVKYSRYVTLNLAQFKDGISETEVTFPEPYNEIYQPEKLEEKIKISLLSISVLEEAKKNFISKLKKLELESDFEQGENNEQQQK